MDGTGAQDNPYLVTTWAELVEKAAESEKYVKIDNDIDVLLEYPNGNAPKITLNAFVDGNDKTISRWYNTGNNYLIDTNSTYSAYIENVKFTNIRTSYSLIYNYTMSSNFSPIRNCTFAGLMQDGYVFNTYTGTATPPLRGITINIKGSNLRLLKDRTNNNHYNCNIKLKSNAASLYYNNTRNATTVFNDSYLDLDMPNLTQWEEEASAYMAFNNCALDIKTNSTLAMPTGNSVLSIYNQTHGPNLSSSDTSKIVGVADSDWLNLSALSALGFNTV